MEDKYLVTQSNNLIEASHKNPLTARKQKIVLTMVSMIQPSDEDFKDYRISVKRQRKVYANLKAHVLVISIEEMNNK